MPGRLLDVTAYTTLDFVETTVRGPDWTDEGPGVVDVRVPDDGGSADRRDDGIVLEMELDPTSHRRTEPHADRIALTREQARTLADALVAAAGAEEDDGRGHDGR